MMEPKMMDHLFRHQFGKMVSILTRIFGLEHLDTIEDAVQDTFVKATIAWRDQVPDNPEAWLTQAAKNRAIDLFRKFNAEKARIPKIDHGPASMAIYDLFLDNEIEDSQLRMIFAACHLALNPKDQLSFSLKTISGFSSKEIASALLLKEETVKKRLTRARKAIQTQGIFFEIPQGNDLPRRLNRVLEVIYLIFNEGFHSNRQDILIRQELCGEAIRLCKMLLKNKFTNTSPAYALFALMCFHAARLESKVSPTNEIIDLEHQDRSQWHRPLITLGNHAMIKAVENDEYSSYHIEAAIAAEHLHAPSFKATNWEKILMWYKKLYDLQPSPMTLLNIAMVTLQVGDLEEVHQLLAAIDSKELEQRAYLYFGAWAEYYFKQGQQTDALASIDRALELVQNEAERQFLIKKKTNHYGLR